VLELARSQGEKDFVPQLTHPPSDWALLVSGTISGGAILQRRLAWACEEYLVDKKALKLRLGRSY